MDKSINGFTSKFETFLFKEAYNVWSVPYPCIHISRHIIGYMIYENQCGSIKIKLLTLIQNIFVPTILNYFPSINAQCRSMPIKIMALIRNASQCRSLPINSDQCRIKSAWSGIDRHWSALRGIERNWSALIGTDWHWYQLILIGINRHWALTEGVLYFAKCAIKDLEPFVKAMYRELESFVEVLTYQVLSTSKIASPGLIYLI